MLPLLLAAAALAAPSIVTLQAEATTLSVAEGVTLTSLAPAHNRWLLLNVEGRSYHLEVAQPRQVTVDLTRVGAGALHLIDPSGTATCAPWTGSPSALDQAAADTEAYAPLCGGRLWLRRDMKGRRSPLEWSVEQVRDRFEKGEQLTELAKRTVFRDRHLEVARTGGDAPTVQGPGAPRPLSVTPSAAGRTLSAPNLGIPVLGDKGSLPVGQWVPTTTRGVWLAAVAPGQVAVDPAVAPKTALDPQESKALALLVAFDLGQLALGFEVGTEHPRVGWSERAPAHVKPPGSKGPDGIDTVAPVARTGLVAPWEVGSLAATFTGGFKRTHGAFKSGPYAGTQQGTHYGWVQDGVVMSSLQPGLATLVVWADGQVELRTWTEADAARLREVRHARQNGVPLVRTGEDGVARAGAFVDQWGAGNWSGSAEGQLRSLRASACVVEAPSNSGPARRYLVYGWFSAATPAGMSRVLLAAGCPDAMLLDMNALEHTYLAVYRPGPGRTPVPHHIDTGMAVLDKTDKAGAPLPRFVALPDNRDFFLLTRKDDQ